MENKPETAVDIIKSLPERLITEKCPDFEVIYHFNIEGERGGEFTVTVNSGNCTVSEGLNGEPKCIIKATDSDYEDVELGRSNAQMAVMMGKIKVSNIGSMMKFMEMFNRLF
ncbi:MAG: hydrogenase expression protein HypA [Flavobacteriales bacterium]|nr:MAG: hydrogenase expression protein HypA [Flavobacteriales bacterium]